MNDRTLTIKCYAKASGNRTGVALLLTLMVLVILTGIVYSISTRITMRKHRQQYIIDYQKARYACDSGLKYAYAMIPTIDMTLKNREEDFPELYDFSDIFWMNREQYDDLRMEWAIKQEEKLELEAMERDQSLQQSETPMRNTGMDEFFDATYDRMTGPNNLDYNRNRSRDMMFDDEYGYGQDPNKVEIPGPYNVPWPYVIKPLEFKIGDAKIKITIEDENAKFPLIWATQGTEEEMDQRSEIALETFCDWMQMENEQIDNLKEQVLSTATHKQFRHVYKQITVKEVVRPKSVTPKPTSRAIKRRRRTFTPKPATRTRRIRRGSEEHASDFAKLMHHSAIDLTELAMQVPDIEARSESPIKYLALWGSSKVNVNTAPRHVLEAAFSYGGQSEEIAAEIIQMRRNKAFTNIEDLKKRLKYFDESIKQVTPYITMQSEYLTIKVTANYGKVTTTSIAAVLKTGKKFKKIAAFSY